MFIIQNLFTMKLLGILILAYFLSGTTQDIDITISDAELKEIQFLREEEKLAHDVYSFLYEKWEIPVFNNIANSESRHFNAIGFLIETYDLEDRASETPGIFQNRKLQALYDSLIIAGSTSLADALKVGAYIEEVDILDLQKLLSSTSEETIKRVCSNLKGASENHLRAFTRQLEFRDIDYLPQALTTDEFNSIMEINSAKGMGKGMCMMQQKNPSNCPNNGNRKRMRRRGNF